MGSAPTEIVPTVAARASEKLKEGADGIVGGVNAVAPSTFRVRFSVPTVGTAGFAANIGVVYTGAVGRADMLAVEGLVEAPSI